MAITSFHNQRHPSPGHFMYIVGLGHYSRTGKDSLANALIACLQEREPKLRVKKLPLAWKLKQICFELYAWAGVREPEFYDTPEGEKYRDIMLPALGMTPVGLWVKYGTDAVREQVYPDTWLDFVFETDHGTDVLIVPDVRFPNEHRKARQKNATLVKVVRPGFGPRKTKADRALLGCVDWDIVAGGSGEMRELHEWASRLACEITGGKKAEQSIDDKARALAVEVIEPCEHDPADPYLGYGVVEFKYEPSKVVKGIVIPATAENLAQLSQSATCTVERSPNGPHGYGSRSTYGGTP